MTNGSPDGIPEARPNRPPGPRRRHAEPAPQPPRRGGRRRLGGWLIGGLAGLAALAGAAAVAVHLLIGQTVQVPGWLQTRIEARIDMAVAPLEVGFDGMSFVLREGWRPRVRLRGAVLMDAGGQEVMRLDNAEASLAMRPLLRGQLLAKRIYLSGATALLRRDREGRFSLSFGSGAFARSAPDLPGLVAQWDRTLMLPQLAALRDVELAALTLRLEDLRLGRAWTLDGGRVMLTRTGDVFEAKAGFSLLGGGALAGLVEASYSSRVGETAAQFGVTVEDIAAGDIAVQAAALNWLEPLRAPISGALRGSVDAAGALGPVSATLQIGAGVLQPDEAARAVPFDGARSYFTFDPGQRVLIFDELSVDSPWGRGTAEGRAYLGEVNSEGRLTELVGQLSVSGLRANPDGLYDAPVVLPRAAADFRLELQPFRLSLGQMELSDGVGTLVLSGRLDASAATAEAAGGWSLSVNGRMDRLTPARLLHFWPEAAAPKPRRWVAENLPEGNLRNIDLGLRLEPGEDPRLFADFDFDGAEIRFVRSMPPVTGAAGQATLDGRRFVVTATAGRIEAETGGAVDVTGTSFIIPDVGIRRAAPGIVRVVGEGPATAVLSLLNRPPLEVLKGTPLPVDVASGSVRATGTVSMELKSKLAFSEIGFHFEGEIGGARSERLVPGYVLTAERLRVAGDQDGVEISGPVRIGDLPAEMTWRQKIGKGVAKDSRVTGTVELSPRAVETFGIGLPAGSVRGQGQGQFTLDLSPGAAPRLSLTSDLKGVELRAPELAWRKPPGAAGLLQLTGQFGDRARIDKLVIQGPGLTATGSVVTTEAGGLERALFSSVRRGDWLDAQIELRGRGNAAPSIRILAGRMDMRRADFGPGGSGGGGGGGAAGPPMQVSLDRLQVTDTIALTGFSGSFTSRGALAGSFRGRINGQTEVAGELIPQNGGSAVRVQSADAGGVFRASGLLTQGRGGAFNMTLVPAGAEGQYNGTLRVTETRVKDAPAIAALLNAVSVIGLVDEMSGQGIQFSEVEAKFRLSPATVTVYSSSAVGPSIGLSMDGQFDVPTGRLNMRGVVTPLYLLNGIGSVVTQRKGEGVFGFNYTLRGTAEQPAVSVNPLSALTPSIFRDIFRGPRPKSPEEAAREAKEPPKPPREFGGNR